MRSLQNMARSVWGIVAAASLASLSCRGSIDPTDGMRGFRRPNAASPSFEAATPLAMPVHHLTSAEYNNTVAHLLGTSLRPADYFPSNPPTGFDGNVGVLRDVSPVLTQAYYDAAKALAADAFAHPDTRARILTCDAASETDTGCARTIVEAFGAKAFRRPLEAAEVERLVTRYAEARTVFQMKHAEAVEHVV